MASIQHIKNFIFLLALIISQEILYTDGRQLKAVKKNKFSTIKIETRKPNNAREVIHKDKAQVTRSKQSPPLPPSTLSHNLSSSPLHHPESFAPTTPGNSPGIGHSFTDKKNNMQAKMQDFASGAQEINDFRPTVPGHSPGVGHSVGTKNAGPGA